MIEIPIERIRKALRYEPETGEFFWRERKIGRPIGRAGSLNKTYGYRVICIDMVSYRENRLAWAYMTGEQPPEDVDHVNRDKADNRWANLRLASRAENAVNTSIRTTNRSGCRGVSWDEQRGKWLAQIRIGGKKKNLGRFLSLDEASRAWLSAAKQDRQEFRFS